VIHHSAQKAVPQDARSPNGVALEEKPKASVEADIRDVDLYAQQVARAAVMEMPLFPDLTVALRKAMGYGPHVEMLQHFCYWFHPLHPKMQERWMLYKTYEEWRNECALSRKQVGKGRKTLRALGLITEKKGPYGRIHYRVDWVAVANILSLSPVGEQTDDPDNKFVDVVGEDSLSPIGEQEQFVPQGAQSNLSPKGEQPNTGDYAGDYLTGDSLLQSGAEPAKAEPAPPPIDQEEPTDLDDLEQPDEQRCSQVRETRHETIAARAEIADPESAKSARKLRAALENPTPQLREALERYYTGEIDHAGLAEAMRRQQYLAGSLAWSQLRPDQVAETLEELGLERVIAAS
jgi:hypothetical protein